MYDVVERYRDLGGNLAFLSANNFFYRVERRGAVLHGRVRWRDIGRPEARLIGSQYVDWFRDTFPSRPYRVIASSSSPWLFAGTGLRDGSGFGRFGIEIDARTTTSPPGTRVLARIPSIFGRGKSAEMTYYETRRGAMVFAAGALNFAGAAWYPPVSRMLHNIWEHLARTTPPHAATDLSNPRRGGRWPRAMDFRWTGGSGIEISRIARVRQLRRPAQRSRSLPSFHHSPGFKRCPTRAALTAPRLPAARLRTQVGIRRCHPLDKVGILG
jgi:hypothetical protein